METASKLMHISYYDPAQEIRLTVYADTIIYEVENSKNTLRAIRFGGYPEMVRAMSDAYHPGDELDCIVKAYDREQGQLTVSVKETQSNPFDGAELRHPIGSRRQAVIAGKYAGGVFCNLTDGAVCMCSYSYHYEDGEFAVGDNVILIPQRYENEKKQIYGKIVAKW